MVAILSVSSKLEGLTLEFRYSKSRPDGENESLLPPKRSILPALSRLHLKGVTEYLEELVTGIDTPQLDEMRISFRNQIISDLPRLVQFMNRTSKLRKREKAHVKLCNGSADILFGTLQIFISAPYRQPDRLLLPVTRICNPCFDFLSTVKDLYINITDRNLQLVWDDDAIGNLWLQLLLPFTAVKNIISTYPRNLSRISRPPCKNSFGAE